MDPCDPPCFAPAHRVREVWKGKWGVVNSLVLSMGMSSDFEAALKAESDSMRVGTGLFGERPTKTSN